MCTAKNALQKYEKYGRKSKTLLDQQVIAQAIMMKNQIQSR